MRRGRRRTTWIDALLFAYEGSSRRHLAQVVHACCPFFFWFSEKHRGTLHQTLIHILSRQVGCGTTVLPARFKEALSEADLAAAQKTIRELDRVRIRDAEHLHYYRAFRTVFGPGDPPGMVRWGPDPCVACGYELQQPSQMFCVVCGEYPARKPAGGERKDGAGGGGKGGSNGGGGQSAKGVMGGKGNSGGIGERKEGETEEGGLRSGGEGTATGDAQESVSARGGAQSLANEGGASSMVGRETRNGGKETAGANRPQLLVADVSVPGFDKSLERNNSSERVVGSGGQRESPKFLAPVSRTSSADSNEDYASADEYFDESDG